MPSVFAVYMWYAVNKLVYMTVYVLEIELVLSFFSGLPFFFYIFVFYLRSVGYIASYKLNFQN